MQNRGTNPKGNSVELGAVWVVQSQRLRKPATTLQKRSNQSVKETLIENVKKGARSLGNLKGNFTSRAVVTMK
jgi:hypothetical protein